MDATTLTLLTLAASVAGSINAVAGGGSLLTFPALLAAGIPPVTASATNTLALCPGVVGSAIAYRREVMGRRRLAFALSVPAIVGGIVGAAILVRAPASTFKSVLPYLVLGATLLLVFKDRIGPKTPPEGQVSMLRRVLVGCAILGFSIYGGYFGAGLGIIVLGVVSTLGRMHIHQLNAIKSVITSAVNVTAALYFLAIGAGDLPTAVVMAAGSSAGGYFGAALARRLPGGYIRAAIAAIGLSLSVSLLLR